MQLILLGLALAIFMHDTPEFSGLGVVLPLGWLLVCVLVPKAILALGYAWACRRTTRRLGKAGGMRSINRLNRFTALFPLFALASFVLDLWAGLPSWLRGADTPGTTGPRDWVLIDELVVMLPTLGLLVFSYWVYYPIDRRLREATLLTRADQGLPLYPVWTRRQYVTAQIRNHFAMILGPLLVIMAWSETLVKLQTAGHITGTTQLWLMPVGAGVAFLFAPLMIRKLWDTVPLPPGPIRDKLLSMCDRHRVRVSDLLLWRTFGGMINAAVMGLFGRVRFILLSDGLLDQVNEREVEAVMAHELAHVRMRHLWWLLISAAAGVGVLSVLGETLLKLGGDWPAWVQAGLSVVGLVLWALQFGWVSRRIERQADTFGARHMTVVHDERTRATPGETTVEAELPSRAPATLFDEFGVASMIGALQRVADLNHIATNRRSWRHGSIAWRQAYLSSLIGQPLDRPPIDRMMWKINAVSLLLLVGVIVWGVVG
ncbi:M48 family metallopeptidase [Algisphaera agarilytica]|uniref:STE24 endopeptidase n=1 Tax=Algisphaera agarilytica TaxID=1385975 RepID=A0A7X0H886_9BACT|nr:M48 family metallopeptidase [Algisphaera agarilytica]MBB6431097.1 STE24 endopeptidase [Algisphaera agarilytica]